MGEEKRVWRWFCLRVGIPFGWTVRVSPGSVREPSRGGQSGESEKPPGGPRGDDPNRSPLCATWSFVRSDRLRSGFGCGFSFVLWGGLSREPTLPDHTVQAPPVLVPNTEVKLHQARIVLRCASTREVRVLGSFLFLFCCVGAYGHRCFLPSLQVCAGLSKSRQVCAMHA